MLPMRGGYAQQCPDVFLEADVARFERWLRNRSCPYLVTESARHEILACGGYTIDRSSRVATLTFLVRECYGADRLK